MELLIEEVALRPSLLDTEKESYWASGLVYQKYHCV